MKSLDELYMIPSIALVSDTSVVVPVWHTMMIPPDISKQYYLNTSIIPSGTVQVPNGKSIFVGLKKILPAYEDSKLWLYNSLTLASLAAFDNDASSSFFSEFGSWVNNTGDMVTVRVDYAKYAANAFVAGTTLRLYWSLVGGFPSADDVLMYQPGSDSLQAYITGMGSLLGVKSSGRTGLAVDPVVSILLR